MVIAKDVIFGILGLYALAWAVALAFMVFLALVLVVSRGRSDAVRDAFRRAVAAGSPEGAVHRAGRAGSPADTAGAISGLQSVDPGFDVTAFLDSARIAVGAYAMAHAAQDDRLLRRITTSSYWQTLNGKAVAAAVAEWRRYAGDRPGATNHGRMVLDISWRQPEVKNVALGDQGMDRITVRLASVIAGAAGPGWQRTDEVTRFDWDFVRPAGQGTDSGAVLLPRTCADCGGPYRSDLDDACPFCHAARPDTQAGWRLDRMYLVVGT
jgi:predicted lipid-binding transport protein (Tim44 family)